MTERVTTKRERLAAWALVLVVASNFYSTGAGAMEGVVNYRTWLYVGDAEWHAFRAAMSEWLLPVFVAPFFGSFLLKLLLLKYRPAGVPKWGVLTLVGLHLYFIVITVTLFIPSYQAPLDLSHDRPLIERLILLNFELRELPNLVQIGLTAYLAVCAILPPRTLAAAPDGTSAGQV